MHPGTVFANIGHFKEIGIDTRGFRGIFKCLEMQFGGAGGDNNAVQLFFPDRLAYGLLTGFTAAVFVGIHIRHILNALCFLGHFFDVHCGRDIASASAEKHANTNSIRLCCHLA